MSFFRTPISVNDCRPGTLPADLLRRPFALLPDQLSTIVQAAARGASGNELRAGIGRFGSSQRSASSSYGNNVAIIPIYGIISLHGTFLSRIFGGTSIEQLTRQVRTALADTSVATIVLDVDSPGGGVEGVSELAAEIMAGRARKKIIAVANSMAASAAYWLASAASQVVVIPSGQVGSIGVFAAHEDISKALEMEGVKISLVGAGKYKTDGNPYEPLSTSARSDMLEKAQYFYGMFTRDVARGRGISQDQVRSGFGQGRMVVANTAFLTGMVDRMATLDEVLTKPDGKSSLSAAFADARSRLGVGSSMDWRRSAERRRRELDLH